MTVAVLRGLDRKEKLYFWPLLLLSCYFWTHIKTNTPSNTKPAINFETSGTQLGVTCTQRTRVRNLKDVAEMDLGDKRECK
jgi:hypothetical protein